MFLAFMIVVSKADGLTDPFYKRFTTPKQDNLIIGTSGAAQGIQPKILDNILNREFFNYAFSAAHSPYGPTYLNSIKKKINPKITDGIFIVTVDPWGISSWAKNPNDSLSFRELELCLANTSIVDINPNPIYLLNNYKEKYFNIFTKNDSISYLHDDGWLEITVNMKTSKVEDRMIIKEKTYKEDYLPKTKFSEIRLNYLKKTILYLQDYGEVYLVRLPIHPRMRAIENEYMPDFEKKINEVIKYSSGYLSLDDKDEYYQYVDGNHLYKKSGVMVTERIGDWISGQRNAYNE
jgi:hypothetical protein